MPYSRRTRVHHLTARQVHHLSQLQRHAGPTSVLSQVGVPTFSTSAAAPAPRTTSAGARRTDDDASITRTTALDGNAAPFEPLAAGRGAAARGSSLGGGDRVGSSPTSDAGYDRRTESEPPKAVLPPPLREQPRGEVSAARPCSRRSDSQTEFQIVQRGAHGNIVLLSSESQDDAQPIELESSSSATRIADDEWELLSYDEEDDDAGDDADEDDERQKRSTRDSAADDPNPQRLVAATA
ncbi:hypothetical protein JCM11491_005017 [Sporobolomyces phaffii]